MRSLAMRTPLQVLLSPTKATTPLKSVGTVVVPAPMMAWAREESARNRNRAGIFFMGFSSRLMGRQPIEDQGGKRVRRGRPPDVGDVGAAGHLPEVDRAAGGASRKGK